MQLIVKAGQLCIMLLGAYREADKAKEEEILNSKTVLNVFSC